MVHYSKICSVWLLIIFAEIMLATKNQYMEDNESQNNYNTEEANQLINTNSIEESKTIVEVIQSPTPKFYCHPSPSQENEKYPVILTGKEEKFFEKIVVDEDKDIHIKNMPVFLAADGELVSVTLGRILGSGGSKNAVSFFQDGEKSEEILMLPSVGLAMWYQMVEEEVKVSEEMSKLGILNVQSKRTDLYLESENDAKIFFASYKCPSFESLVPKGIFVIDVKNSRSSQWPRGQSLLYPDDERYNFDTWEPIVAPLVEDLYKLANNNLLFDVDTEKSVDSCNFAIVRTEKAHPKYFVRYFGFDFSSKSKFGKPQRDHVISEMDRYLLRFLLNLFYIQEEADKDNFAIENKYKKAAELAKVIVSRWNDNKHFE